MNFRTEVFFVEEKSKENVNKLTKMKYVKNNIE